jgi:hypothetical protein
MKNGRPSDYDPKYCDMIIDYFAVDHTMLNGRQVEGAELPQFTAFARSIGVARSTLHKWTQEFPDFSDAYNTARQLQEELIANNAMKNRYNAYFAQFMLKNNHGWKDKTEVDQTIQEIKIDTDDERV